MKPPPKNAFGARIQTTLARCTAMVISKVDMAFHFIIPKKQYKLVEEEQINVGASVKSRRT
jgi:hypothetical protein